MTQFHAFTSKKSVFIPLPLYGSTSRSITPSIGFLAVDVSKHCQFRDQLGSKIKVAFKKFGVARREQQYFKPHHRIILYKTQSMTFDRQVYWWWSVAALRMFSLLFDHCMQRPAWRGCVGCFNTLYTLVDVTIGHFLRMCLVGMKRGMESGVEGASAGSTGVTWKKDGCCALSELLATALLVLLGCMTLIPTNVGIYDVRPTAYSMWNGPTPPYQQPTENEHQPLAHAALGFGFLVLANVMVFGGVSGAHMNPAVTLTALLMGECTPRRAVLYAIAQCLGATFGFGVLMYMCPRDAATVMRSACTVPSRVTSLQALLVEVVLTFVLGLVCCAAWRPAGAPAPPPHDPALPIKFGLTVAGLIYTGGLLSGASLNPARSFAPALWTSEWTAHWNGAHGPPTPKALPPVPGAMGRLRLVKVWKKCESTSKFSRFFEIPLVE
ncbi:Aquaporin-4 [Eumeta japonica]|uniref:Aquaporin-4 n=1 Tax=Eumeta variegata TaxID=151549 RepID=A0A4C1WJ65_EUMVA|nr:Aquaporin-4 [Eumeta japonica]